MAEVLTAAQMRAVEQAAMARGDVTGLALMERAGAAVVEAVLAEWPELAGDATTDASESEYLQKDERQGAPRAVVLCGPGNNGGDGFVIARLLAARGWPVTVFFFGAPERLPADARAGFDRLGEGCDLRMLSFPVASDAEVAAFREVASHEPEARAGHDLDPKPPLLVADALFGTGLSRAVTGLEGVFAHWDSLATFRDLTETRLVAVDMPSGVNSDTGAVLAGEAPFAALAADLTVTFHKAKPGHVLGQGPAHCGRLVTVDIGLEDDGGGVALLETPGPVAKRGGHKFDHGHALVLSGPPGAGGAARLAARAALRVGAGVVTVGCPRRAVAEHAVHLNAIMLRGLDGTAGLVELLEDRRINALCLGPGLGLGPATAELVKHALAAGRATVLDADALSRFQRNPQALFDLLHGAAVLTPHGGEFRRLFPDLDDRLAEDRAGFSKVDACREAAARAGCVVLFKGPDTVIAAPDGRVAVNAAVYERAVPWLATAGAGDVLAGMIAGLMARGIKPFEAACAAAWMHVEAARTFGPGLIAEDLPEVLPKVFRALGV